MQLRGESLGERKKEFQTKVNQAVADNVQFDAIKDLPEKTDVNTLFKIEVASKYRNVEYLLEVLKSGDSLYVSKVLKCTWLYEDQYSDRINPDFLHLHIFPHMSTRMKRKFLTIISTYVKNENRCKDWYEYCKNICLTIYAHKFLIYTSTQFKKSLLEDEDEYYNLLLDDLAKEKQMDIKHFIGKDITLAQCYLQRMPDCRAGAIVLRDLSYFYAIDDELYLNWLEKYWPSIVSSKNITLGKNMTKSILKYHKSRVLSNIDSYVFILDKEVLVKNATIDEAKQYLKAKLPENADTFWKKNFLLEEKLLLNLIPPEEQFEFARKIFVECYPKEEFEMSPEFYRLNYFNYMTVEQRESWALRQMANPDKTILGRGKEDMDYLWCKFLTFDRALLEIEKYVKITPDHCRRLRILEVLIQTVQNQRDLEKLFNYYYERHANETQYDKELFVVGVLEHHNVTQVDESCWAAFNKLLNVLDVYNEKNDSYHQMYKLLPPVLVYHILHNLDLPKSVEQFVWTTSPYNFKDPTKNAEKNEIVYQYLLKSRVDKIQSYEGKEYNKENQIELRNLIEFIRQLNYSFDKPREIDIDIVRKYMELDSEIPKYVAPVKRETLDQELMIKLLKQDIKLVIEKLPTLKKILKDQHVKLKTFLTLIKTYFSNDLKQEYLQFYLQLLTEEQSDYALSAAVFGVFKLADEKFKLEFMVKYAPSDVKVDPAKIDKKQLCIQKAICRFATYSRPPVPLSAMVMYFKKDYIKYCVPMFYKNLTKVPMSECMQLIEALLNSKITIVRRYGFRLAFKCFSAAALRRIVVDSWKGTKNRSWRMFIYKYLFKCVLSKDEAKQEEYLEIVLTLTLDVHQDDHRNIFDLFIARDELIDNFPINLLSRYLESCWKLIDGFPKNKENLSRQICIINSMKFCLKHVDKELVKTILVEYFEETFLNIRIQDGAKDRTVNKLTAEKFELALYFIARSDQDGCLKSGLDLLELVVGKCLEMWNETYINDEDYEIYYSRKYLYDFINGIINLSIDDNWEMICASNNICYWILEKLQTTFPLHEIYIFIWRIRLAIIVYEVINEEYPKDDMPPFPVTLVLKIVTTFSTKVAKLVKEIVERKEFNMSLLHQIGTEIEGNIKKLRLVHIGYPKNEIELPDVNVFVSKELVGSGITECILLAITILPCGIPNYSEKEFCTLLKTVKAISNFEVQALLYQKFMKFNIKIVSEIPNQSDHSESK